MNEFSNALVCDHLHPSIPATDDYFGALIGSWDFKRKNLESDGEYHHTEGEWIFSRTLEGWGIQDVFIWPPRASRSVAVREGEYGTTIRTYNAEKRCWDIVYINGSFIGQFTAVREGDCIVQTSKADPHIRWIFSDIMDGSFRWHDERLQLDGTWKLYEELRLTRKK